MSISVLVTGGTGFLGRALVHHLAVSGYKVSFLGRNTTIGKALAKATQTTFIQADLADTATLQKACNNTSAVVHTAALSSPWGKYPNFYAANVQGTANVIAACQQNHVQRLVHISTPSVYAQPQDMFDITEQTPLASHPANAYAATKRLAEDLVNNATGLETVILRPRGIFGEGDTSILPRLLALMEKGPLRLPNGGQNLVELTHVSNVIHAIECALTQPAAMVSGHTFNITNGEPMPLREVLQIVTSQLGKPLNIRNISYPIACLVACAQEAYGHLHPLHPEPRLTRYTLGLITFSQTFNLQKAHSQLGYQPPLSLKDALLITAKFHA